MKLKLLKLLNIKKSIAVATTACFLFTMVFSQGAYAIVTPTQLPVINQNTLKSIENYLLPFNIGRITDALYTGGDEVVINIQDLHSHAQAQRNISSILSVLDNQYDLENVYVEGGIGQVDTSWLSSISNKELREKILNNMLESGRLTGGEYYSVEANKNKLLKGIEDKDTYINNLKRLDEFYSKKQDILKYVSFLKYTLNNVSKKYYTRDNLKLNRVVSKHEAGNLSAQKYFTYLLETANKANINLKRYPNIIAFLQVLKKQEGLDTKKVNLAIAELLNELKTKLSYEQYQTLISKISNKSKETEFYFDLYKVAKENGLLEKSDYKILLVFFDYLSLNQSLNPVNLTLDEQNLLQELNIKLSKTQNEKDIYFLQNYLGYFSGYLTSKLTASDYEYFINNMARFRLLWEKYVDIDGIIELDSYFSFFGDFYKDNVERNRYFIKNIMGKMPDEPKEGLRIKSNINHAQNVLDELSKTKKVKVVITGGFHTYGFTKLLQDNNINYIVITPNVIKQTVNADVLFEDVFREQSSALYNTLQKMLVSQLGGVDSILNSDVLEALDSTKLTSQAISILNKALADKGQSVKVVDLQFGKDENNNNKVIAVLNNGTNKEIVLKSETEQIEKETSVKFDKQNKADFETFDRISNLSKRIRELNRAENKDLEEIQKVVNDLRNELGNVRADSPLTDYARQFNNMDKIFSKENVVLIGPSGSGKSTTVNLVAETTGAEIISFDDLIKEYLTNPSKEGKKLKEGSAEYNKRFAEIKNGSGAEIAELLDSKIKQSGSNNRIFVDGFGRNAEQIDTLKNILGAVNTVFVYMEREGENALEIGRQKQIEAGHVEGSLSLEEERDHWDNNREKVIEKLKTDNIEFVHITKDNIIPSSLIASFSVNKQQALNQDDKKMIAANVAGITEDSILKLKKDNILLQAFLTNPDSLSESEKKYIQQQLKENQKNISFGTAGHREQMPEKFNPFIVVAITYGCAQFIKENGLQKKVLVGNDTRYMGDEYAKLVALTLRRMGIEVDTVEGALSTPAISNWAKNNKGYGMTINITASHNPLEYNGYKPNTGDGAPCNIEDTDQIQHFAAETEPNKILDAVSNNTLAGENVIKATKTEPSGLNKIQLLHKNNVEKIFADSLGIKAEDLKGIFKGDIFIDFKNSALTPELLNMVEYVSDKKLSGDNLINFVPDVSFGYKNPEPNEKNTQELKNKVENKANEKLKEGKSIEEIKKTTFGIATDPDGDRFAIYYTVYNGSKFEAKFLSPDEAGMIVQKIFLENKYNKLNEYLKANHSDKEISNWLKENNYNIVTVRSADTTSQIDKLAKYYEDEMKKLVSGQLKNEISVSVKITDIGFKNLAEAAKLTEKEGIEPLMLLESSGGLVSGLYDKDGLTATLLPLLLLNNASVTVEEELDTIEKDIENSELLGRDAIVFEDKKELTAEQQKQNFLDVTNNFKDIYKNIPEMKNYDVETISPVTIENGIEIVFKNGNSLIVRASGTEPKIRIYTKVNATIENKSQLKKENDALMNLGRTLVEKSGNGEYKNYISKTLTNTEKIVSDEQFKGQLQLTTIKDDNGNDVLHFNVNENLIEEDGLKQLKEDTQIRAKAEGRNVITSPFVELKQNEVNKTINKLNKDIERAKISKDKKITVVVGENSKLATDAEAFLSLSGNVDNIELIEKTKKTDNVIDATNYSTDEILTLMVLLTTSGTKEAKEVINYAYDLANSKDFENVMYQALYASEISGTTVEKFNAYYPGVDGLRNYLFKIFKNRDTVVTEGPQLQHSIGQSMMAAVKSFFTHKKSKYSSKQHNQFSLPWYIIPMESQTVAEIGHGHFKEYSVNKNNFAIGLYPVERNAKSAAAMMMLLNSVGQAQNEKEKTDEKDVRNKYAEQIDNNVTKENKISKVTTKYGNTEVTLTANDNIDIKKTTTILNKDSNLQKGHKTIIEGRANKGEGYKNYKGEDENERPAFHHLLEYCEFDGEKFDYTSEYNNLNEEQQVILDKHIETLNKMLRLFEKWEKDGITTIIFNGIGGSELGPRMIVEFLEAAGIKGKFDIRFISSPSQEAFDNVTNGLKADTTAVVGMSKSGTTRETVESMEKLLDWKLGSTQKTGIRRIIDFIFGKREDISSVISQIAYVSDKDSAIKNSLSKVGVNLSDTEYNEYKDVNKFGFDDSIGGRWSWISAIGMAVVAYNPEAFSDIVKGARNQSLKDNFNDISIALAALGVKGTQIDGNEIQYVKLTINGKEKSFALPQFVEWLKQLQEESNGKGEDIEGNLLDKVSSCESVESTDGSADLNIIIGEKGKVEADSKAKYNLVLEHDGSIAGMLNSFGALLNIFEQKVEADGIMRNVNSFDQPAVQDAKATASQISEQIKNAESDTADPQLDKFIEYYNQNKELSFSQKLSTIGKVALESPIMIPAIFLSALEDILIGNKGDREGLAGKVFLNLHNSYREGSPEVRQEMKEGFIEIRDNTFNAGIYTGLISLAVGLLAIKGFICDPNIAFISSILAIVYTFFVNIKDHTQYNIANPDAQLFLGKIFGKKKVKETREDYWKNFYLKQYNELKERLPVNPREETIEIKSKNEEKEIRLLLQSHNIAFRSQPGIYELRTILESDYSDIIKYIIKGDLYSAIDKESDAMEYGIDFEDVSLRRELKRENNTFSFTYANETYKIDFSNVDNKDEINNLLDELENKIEEVNAKKDNSQLNLGFGRLPAITESPLFFIASFFPMFRGTLAKMHKYNWSNYTIVDIFSAFRSGNINAPQKLSVGDNKEINRGVNVVGNLTVLSAIAIVIMSVVPIFFGAGDVAAHNLINYGVLQPEFSLIDTILKTFIGSYIVNIITHKVWNILHPNAQLNLFGNLSGLMIEMEPYAHNTVKNGAFYTREQIIEDKKNSVKSEMDTLISSKQYKKYIETYIKLLILNNFRYDNNDNVLMTKELEDLDKKLTLARSINIYDERMLELIDEIENIKGIDKKYTDELKNIKNKLQSSEFAIDKAVSEINVIRNTLINNRPAVEGYYGQYNQRVFKLGLQIMRYENLIGYIKYLFNIKSEAEVDELINKVEEIKQLVRTITNKQGELDHDITSSYIETGVTHQSGRDVYVKIKNERLKELAKDIESLGEIVKIEINDRIAQINKKIKESSDNMEIKKLQVEIAYLNLELYILENPELDKDTRAKLENFVATVPNIINMFDSLKLDDAENKVAIFENNNGMYDYGWIVMTVNEDYRKLINDLVSSSSSIDDNAKKSIKGIDEAIKYVEEYFFAGIEDTIEQLEKSSTQKNKTDLLYVLKGIYETLPKVDEKESKKQIRSILKGNETLLNIMEEIVDTKDKEQIVEALMKDINIQKNVIDRCYNGQDFVKEYNNFKLSTDYYKLVDILIPLCVGNVIKNIESVSNENINDYTGMSADDLDKMAADIMKNSVGEGRTVYNNRDYPSDLRLTKDSTKDNKWVAKLDSKIEENKDKKGLRRIYKWGLMIAREVLVSALEFGIFFTPVEEFLQEHSQYTEETDTETIKTMEIGVKVIKWGSLLATVISAFVFIGYNEQFMWIFIKSLLVGLSSIIGLHTIYNLLANIFNPIAKLTKDVSSEGGLLSVQLEPSVEKIYVIADLLLEDLPGIVDFLKAKGYMDENINIDEASQEFQDAYHKAFETFLNENGYKEDDGYEKLVDLFFSDSELSMKLAMDYHNDSYFSAQEPKVNSGTDLENIDTRLLNKNYLAEDKFILNKKGETIPYNQYLIEQLRKRNIGSEDEYKDPKKLAELRANTLLSVFDTETQERLTDRSNPDLRNKIFLKNFKNAKAFKNLNLSLNSNDYYEAKEYETFMKDLNLFYSVAGKNGVDAVQKDGSKIAKIAEIKKDEQYDIKTESVGNLIAGLFRKGLDTQIGNTMVVSGEYVDSIADEYENPEAFRDNFISLQKDGMLSVFVVLFDVLDNPSKYYLRDENGYILYDNEGNPRINVMLILLAIHSAWASNNSWNGDLAHISFPEDLCKDYNGKLSINETAKDGEQLKVLYALTTTGNIMEGALDRLNKIAGLSDGNKKIVDGIMNEWENLSEALNKEQFDSPIVKEQNLKYYKSLKEYEKLKAEISALSNKDNKEKLTFINTKMEEFSDNNIVSDFLQFKKIEVLVNIYNDENAGYVERESARRELVQIRETFGNINDSELLREIYVNNIKDIGNINIEKLDEIINIQEKILGRKIVKGEKIKFLREQILGKQKGTVDEISRTLQNEVYKFYTDYEKYNNNEYRYFVKNVAVPAYVSTIIQGKIGYLNKTSPIRNREVEKYYEDVTKKNYKEESIEELTAMLEIVDRGISYVEQEKLDIKKNRLEKARTTIRKELERKNFEFNKEVLLDEVSDTTLIDKINDAKKQEDLDKILVDISLTDPQITQNIIARFTDNISLLDIDGESLKGKTISLVVDLNAPTKWSEEDGKYVITDPTRVDATIRTYKYLNDRGANVILMSHWGRPSDEDDIQKRYAEFNMQPIVDRFEELGVNVQFKSSPTGMSYNRYINILTTSPNDEENKKRIEELEREIENLNEKIEDTKDKSVKKELIREREELKTILALRSYDYDAEFKQGNGNTLLLDNLRFDDRYADKKTKVQMAQQFVDKLGLNGAVYDAFGVSHRDNFATDMINILNDKVETEDDQLGSFQGFLVKAEMDAYNDIVNNPNVPATYLVLGGAKVKDKKDVLDNFVNNAKPGSQLTIQGGMANLFIEAKAILDGKDYQIGDSLTSRAGELIDKDQYGEPINKMVDKDLAYAIGVIRKAEEKGISLIIPMQVKAVPADKMVFGGEYEGEYKIIDFTNGESVPKGWMIVDMAVNADGNDTETYKQIKEAMESIQKVGGTIIMNGPAGVFETKPFNEGTNAVTNLIADVTTEAHTETGERAKSFAGGGDSVASIKEAGVEDKFSWVSTGGGAVLNLLEGNKSAAIEAIPSKNQKQIDILKLGLAIKDLENKDDYAKIVKELIETDYANGSNNIGNILRAIEQGANVKELFESLSTVETHGRGLSGYINDFVSLVNDDSSPIDNKSLSVPSPDSGVTVRNIEDVNDIKLTEEQIVEIPNLAIIKVAGGVGDRLKYKGIKIGIKLGLIDGKTYMENDIEEFDYYADIYYKAKGKNVDIPMAIMTSDDTHDDTQKLLKEIGYTDVTVDNNTGLVTMTNKNKERGVKTIYLMKQENVPAIEDYEGNLAMEDGKLKTKPHGHGDVHSLVYNMGIVDLFTKSKAEPEKIKIAFIQDANGPVNNTILPSLETMNKENKQLAIASVTRAQGEKAGVLIRTAQKYKDEDGKEKDIPGTERVENIEYNYINELFSEEEQDKYKNANLNVFVIGMEKYNSILESNGGIIGEFTNPKTDGSNKFTSPARSETMMQDIFKEVGVDDVCIVNFKDKILAHSPSKNAIAVLNNGNLEVVENILGDTMISAEENYYRNNRKLLDVAGVKGVSAKDEKEISILGKKVNVGPQVLIKKWGRDIDTFKNRFSGNNKVSNKSTIQLTGNVGFENVTIDGAVKIEAKDGVQITLTGEFNNKGYERQLVSEEEMISFLNGENNIDKQEAIRGYRFNKVEEFELSIDKPGDYEVVGQKDGKVIVNRKVNGKVIDTFKLDKTGKVIIEDTIKKEQTSVNVAIEHIQIIKSANEWLQMQALNIISLFKEKTEIVAVVDVETDTKAVEEAMRLAEEGIKVTLIINKEQLNNIVLTNESGDNAIDENNNLSRELINNDIKNLTIKSYENTGVGEVDQLSSALDIVKNIKGKKVIYVSDSITLTDEACENAGILAQSSVSIGTAISKGLVEYKNKDKALNAVVSYDSMMAIFDIDDDNADIEQLTKDMGISQIMIRVKDDSELGKTKDKVENLTGIKGVTIIRETDAGYEVLDTLGNAKDKKIVNYNDVQGKSDDALRGSIVCVDDTANIVLNENDINNLTKAVIAVDANILNAMDAIDTEKDGMTMLDLITLILKRNSPEVNIMKGRNLVMKDKTGDMEVEDLIEDGKIKADDKLDAKLKELGIKTTTSEERECIALGIIQALELTKVYKTKELNVKNLRADTSNELLTMLGEYRIITGNSYADKDEQEITIDGNYNEILSDLRNKIKSGNRDAATFEQIIKILLTDQLELETEIEELTDMDVRVTQALLAAA